MNPVTLCVCEENSDPKKFCCGHAHNRRARCRQQPGSLRAATSSAWDCTNSAGSRGAPLQSSIAERGGGNVRTTPVPILLSAGRLCRHKLLCRLVQLAMREVKGNGYLPKKGANPPHPSSSR